MQAIVNTLFSSDEVKAYYMQFFLNITSLLKKQSVYNTGELIDQIQLYIQRNIGVNKKSESILRAIIDMAHQLGIRLVAEGAETEEQAAFLRANGCDYIQGYYYYKPMPENEFLQLLDEGK